MPAAARPGQEFDARSERDKGQAVVRQVIAHAGRERLPECPRFRLRGARRAIRSSGDL